MHVVENTIGYRSEAVLQLEKDVSNAYDSHALAQMNFLEEWATKVYPEELTPEIIKEYQAIEDAAAGISTSATAEQVKLAKKELAERAELRKESLGTIGGRMSVKQ